jgi:hypothetical protein
MSVGVSDIFPDEDCKNAVQYELKDIGSVVDNLYNEAS